MLKAGAGPELKNPPMVLFQDGPALNHVSIAHGHPLPDNIVLQSSLLQGMLSVQRDREVDAAAIINGNRLRPGFMHKQPGVRTALLAQDIALSDDRPVFDVVAEGLGGLGDLVSAYHHAAVEVAERGIPELLEKLGRLQHELEEEDGWRLEQRVEMVLARLKLPPDTRVNTLSRLVPPCTQRARAQPDSCSWTNLPAADLEAITA
jgi:ATP-binding cassette subfamily F protein uup